MPRKKKPQLTGIEGALSIYRIGDKVTFDIGSVEFNAPIDAYYVDGGRPYVNLTIEVRLPVGLIKKIVRAA